MMVTKDVLYNGCLIASIAHAIMTNAYPELSYEQSWDGMNYSIQDSSGARGTISFSSDYCVGAVRNDRGILFIGEETLRLMKGFPDAVLQKAKADTLEYLLLGKHGVIQPCVTSMFWADNNSIRYNREFADTFKVDFKLFENMILPKDEAIAKWRAYYKMDSNAIILLESLYQMKKESFFENNTLSKEQISLFPNNSINNECVESLMELNIHIS